MLKSCVPKFIWPEAIDVENNLTNHLPNKSINYQTPLNSLQNLKDIPLSHTLCPRLFGCIVYVHLLKRSHNKLEARPLKCVFERYEVTQKGYRCLDPITNHIYTTMDCYFVENEFYYTNLGHQREQPIDHLSWLTRVILSCNPTIQKALQPRIILG